MLIIPSTTSHLRFQPTRDKLQSCKIDKHVWDASYTREIVTPCRRWIGDTSSPLTLLQTITFFNDKAWTDENLVIDPANPYGRYVAPDGYWEVNSGAQGDMAYTKPGEGTPSKDILTFLIQAGQKTHVGECSSLFTKKVPLLWHGVYKTWWRTLQRLSTFLFPQADKTLRVGECSSYSTCLVCLLFLDL
jgi:hypothetical protein